LAHYFLEVETVDEDDDNLNSITRSKRDADSYDYMITPTRTRCPLLLVADYRFFREMGGGDTKTTINYLVSIYFKTVVSKLIFKILSSLESSFEYNDLAYNLT